MMEEGGGKWGRVMEEREEDGVGEGDGGGRERKISVTGWRVEYKDEVKDERLVVVIHVNISLVKREKIVSLSGRSGASEGWWLAC